MIENNAQEQEQLEVSIEDDGQVAAPESSEDELDRYTKGVSKRINKLNQKTRDVEQQNAILANQLAQVQAENENMRRQQQINRSAMLVQEEENMKSVEKMADVLYKRAVDSGDAEMMKEATKLQGKLEIKKEKLRVARSREGQEAQQVLPEENYQAAPQQQQSVQPVQPSQRAKDWHAKNAWYGDENSDHPEYDKEASEWAFFNHYKLVNEGYEADTEEYFEELSNRVYKYHPHLQKADEDVEQENSNPPVQRVASAPAGGRQKTQAKKNGVRFTSSELENARRMKPHDMSDEQWLQLVAREKQKIAARQAS